MTTIANKILVLTASCCDFCCWEKLTKTTSLDSHALEEGVLKYTNLATYELVKPICVLNMLTFILLRANTGFWTVALTNISPYK